MYLFKKIMGKAQGMPQSNDAATKGRENSSKQKPENNPSSKLPEGLITNEARHEKTKVLVSDLVRHKPGCTATEDG